MNPNLSQDEKTGEDIPYCDDMDAHATIVWKDYVLNSGFEKVLLIAHSAGGGCVT